MCTAGVNTAGFTETLFAISVMFTSIFCTPPLPQTTQKKTPRTSGNRTGNRWLWHEHLQLHHSCTLLLSPHVSMTDKNCSRLRMTMLHAKHTHTYSSSSEGLTTLLGVPSG